MTTGFVFRAPSTVTSTTFVIHAEAPSTRSEMYNWWSAPFSAPHSQWRDILFLKDELWLTDKTTCTCRHQNVFCGHFPHTQCRGCRGYVGCISTFHSGNGKHQILVTAQTSQTCPDKNRIWPSRSCLFIRPSWTKCSCFLTFICSCLW